MSPCDGASGDSCEAVFFWSLGDRRCVGGGVCAIKCTARLPLWNKLAWKMGRNNHFHCDERRKDNRRVQNAAQNGAECKPIAGRPLPTLCLFSKHALKGSCLNISCAFYPFELPVFLGLCVRCSSSYGSLFLPAEQVIRLNPTRTASTGIKMEKCQPIVWWQPAGRDHFGERGGGGIFLSQMFLQYKKCKYGSVPGNLVLE